MSERRRQFLGWLGASTLLAVFGRDAAAQQAGGARANGVAPAPTSDEWDVSWTERVRGAARAVFDVPDGQGEGVWRAGRWMEDYRGVYGAKPDDLTAVLVIRHAAIQFIMDNEYWKRFDVGKKREIRDRDTKKWVTANPVSTAHAGAPTDDESHTIQHFVAHGGIVLACHLAFAARVIPDFARADALSREEAESRARAHIIPGVILQSSGVFAALRAQQAGCSYIVAS